MIRKRKEEEYVSYQVNDDFTSGEEVNWDEVIGDEEKPKKKKTKRRKNEDLDYDFEKKEKKGLRINIKVFIGVAIYGCFLGLGALITTYTTNNNPQVIPVALREDRNEFKKAESDYRDISKVITEIDKIDSLRKSSSENESFQYAIDYKEVSELISKSKKEIEGTNYSQDYVFMQTIASQIYENIYQYLILMSDGMSTQNAKYVVQAEEYKQKYKIQFEKYTDNIEQFETTVKYNE